MRANRGTEGGAIIPGFGVFGIVVKDFEARRIYFVYKVLMLGWAGLIRYVDLGSAFWRSA